MTDQIMPREHLPWRRWGSRVALECSMSQGQLRFHADYNFYEDGRLGEMFARPFKTGADLETLLDKFCIAVSKLLQHGIAIEDFARSIDEGTPAAARDIFGALVMGGVEAEAHMKRELAAMTGAGCA